jgi:acetyltransferase-like isoleucine patch superfamily enzyme
MQNKATARADSPRPFVVERALSVAAEHAGDSPETAELLYRQVLDAAPGDAEARAGLAEARARAARSARHLARQTVEALAQQPRIWKYRVLSSCPNVTGSAIELQPVLFVGAGEIVLGDGVQFGWRRSPLFYTGYCHVEVARADARIELGDRVEFNNNAMLKSEGPGIRVGRDALFGAHVEIFDSNFHDLDPRRRHGGQARMAAVDVGENTFVGMSVKILKGVTIGADSVIGAGAVVTTSIPAGVIAAGNPARVVREL